MSVTPVGGHTAEIMRLMNVLRPEVYCPRCYVIAETDELGVTKATELEKQIAIRHSKPSETSQEVGQVVMMRISLFGQLEL
jgi:hypothetical protein